MEQITDRILSRKEAAIFLSRNGLTMAAQTLARLLSEGRGPPCMRVGSRSKYKESHLRAYLIEQTSAPRRSTSEPLRPIDPDDFPAFTSEVPVKADVVVKGQGGFIADN